MNDRSSCAHERRPFLPLALSAVATVSIAAGTFAATTDVDEVLPLPKFEAPVQLTAAGAPIRTDAPGYAAPAWFDVDQDGRMDLVVGQFSGGKMAVYRGQEDGQFAARKWLEVGGKVAEVPGVW